MKKILFLILLVLLFLSNKLNVKADSAKSSIVMDMDKNRILYCNNCHDKRLIASITKIMTAIITIENIDIEKEVTVGEEVLKMYGTNIYIEMGEKISIKDLLYGLMLRSGNDASVVLAKNVSGSIENFVNLMNKKAKEIGMNDTIFLNPHGLDEETKNYSTAYDMAILTNYAYKNEIFREIFKTKKYSTKTHKKSYIWYNRNKLLNMYKYTTGGKNGYTPSAGKTLVSTATKDNLNLVIVSLKDTDTYNNHKNLYNYYFNKYKNYKIVNKDTFYIDKELCNYNIYLKKDFIYPLKENELDKIKTFVKINKYNKNNEVGKIYIYLDNNIIGTVNIYKKKNKRTKSFIDKLLNIFNLNYLILKNI